MIDSSWSQVNRLRHRSRLPFHSSALLIARPAVRHTPRRITVRFGRSNPITAPGRRHTRSRSVVECPSITQRSPATTARTRRRNSSAGSGVQPAWWYTESSSSQVAPSLAASAAANVDLPAPDVPMTETRRTAATVTPGHGACHLAPAGPRRDDGHMTEPVRAPRGPQLSCKAWPQEAAMRMLMNNLDPEVAEHPDQLIVYGGSGRAARSWAAFDAIVASLTRLAGDETLLVQSGKPVGVFRTHEWAPRVLIANSNMVPQWATWEEFRRLEAAGLTMFGQMTAGSWIYIGTQGILQGTYETFAAVAARRFGGSLAGTITLTAGLGGMGGAQPLAVTMNGGVAICVDCDPSRISRRIEHGYLDIAADGIGDAADVVPRMLAIGAPVNVVTDQTSAHDPLTYLPRGVAFEDMPALRAED